MSGGGGDGWQVEGSIVPNILIKESALGIKKGFRVISGTSTFSSRPYRDQVRQRSAVHYSKNHKSSTLVAITLGGTLFKFDCR